MTRIFRVLYALPLALLLAAPAIAQDYPARPIRIIVGFTPGGPVDLLGRAVAQNLQAAWGQPVIVDNRPGASGNIGMAAAAHAAPDGYTLAVSTASGLTVNQTLYSSPGYDPAKDFVPITELAKMDNILVVNAKLPIHSMAELVSAAKAKPGAFSFGSPGNGSQAHLKGELLKLQTGIDIVHIPYRGDAQAMIDLLSGQITMMIGLTPSVMPYIKDGQLRPLGAASAKRVPALPDLPTFGEQNLPSFDSSTWYALVAPAGTPVAIVDKIGNEVRRILALPHFKQTIETLGAEPVGNSSAELAALIKSESARWADVIRRAKITAD